MIDDFTPFAAGTDHDPYPLYRRMREEEPVHCHPEGFYVVSRLADLRTISRDWQRFSNARGIDIDQTGRQFGPNFLNSDPPHHRLIRRLVQHRFSPKTVRNDLEPVVRQRVTDLVDGVAGSSAVDMASEFAWPLPFSIACHLLGLPMADRDFLADASRRFEEREVGQPLPPPSAQSAADDLREYFSALIEDRRRRPGNDLVSLLVSADPDGEPLSEEELIGTAFLLFDAGTQTTACLLTNTLVLLDAYPEQRAWLRQNTDRIAGAVEEFLRFETPLQHLARRTNDVVELHGTEIPFDSTVLLLYGSANRDHRKWSDPERLDLARKPQRHVAFGDGIHHCLGAPIARLEVSVALELLLPHLSRFRLTGKPSRLSSHELRGYIRVPAAFD